MLAAMIGAALSGTAPVPVADENGLRAHLCAGAPSPLDALSVGGRLRLLARLSFGERWNATSYLPLVSDLTGAEKAAIVDLLRLEAYRTAPSVRRSESARFDSSGLPGPKSAYCRGEASVADWALAARAEHEGALSAALGTAEREVAAAPDEPGAREAAARRAYGRIVSRPGVVREIEAAPRSVSARSSRRARR